MIITNSRNAPIAEKEDNFEISFDCLMKTTSVHSLSERQNLAKLLNVPKNSSSRCNKVQHVYHDHIYDPETPLRYCTTTSDGKKPRKGPRGGVATPFPLKLHNLLDSNQWSDIISWQPHGRCFLLHKPKEFLSEVMPQNFRQTKLTSFQRQLNLYGFCRLTSGRDKGGYYHELFLRGKPLLCQRMVRMRIKGTRIKAASSPETEPNFYAMPPAMTSTTEPLKATRKRGEGDVHFPPTFTGILGQDGQMVCSSSPVCVSYPASVSSSSLSSQDQEVLSPSVGKGNTTSTFDTTTCVQSNLIEPDVCNFEGKAFHYLESFVGSFDVSHENPPKPPFVQTSSFEDSYLYDGSGFSNGLDGKIAGFEL